MLAAAGLVLRSLQKASPPPEPLRAIEAAPEESEIPRSELTHLETLVYELLDAHADTIRLAGALEEEDPIWGAHNDYLRALQREGRALLSQVVLDQAA